MKVTCRFYRIDDKPPNTDVTSDGRDERQPSTLQSRISVNYETIKVHCATPSEVPLDRETTTSTNKHQREKGWFSSSIFSEIKCNKVHVEIQLKEVISQHFHSIIRQFQINH